MISSTASGDEEHWTDVVPKSKKKDKIPVGNLRQPTDRRGKNKTSRGNEIVNGSLRTGQRVAPHKSYPGVPEDRLNRVTSRSSAPCARRSKEGNMRPQTSSISIAGKNVPNEAGYTYSTDASIETGMSQLSLQGGPRGGVDSSEQLQPPAQQQGTGTCTISHNPTGTSSTSHIARSNSNNRSETNVVQQTQQQKHQQKLASGYLMPPPAALFSPTSAVEVSLSTVSFCRCCRSYMAQLRPGISAEAQREVRGIKYSKSDRGYPTTSQLTSDRAADPAAYFYTR